VLNGLRAMASTDLGGRMGMRVSLTSAIEGFNQRGCPSETKLEAGRTNDGAFPTLPLKS